MGMNITPLTRPEVPLTTSNLIVDSDLSMGNYDMQANNLHVGGSILQVVECIPSETNYYAILSDPGEHNSSIILPYIPSTYYTGSILIWLSHTGTVATVTLYNIDGTHTSINATTTKQIVNLPYGTISIITHVYDYAEIRIGFTNDYLPLPTPPETP